MIPLGPAPGLGYIDWVMKTTLDLPKDLLIAAKQVAARRRTTLQEMVEGYLRQEIASHPVGMILNGDDPYDVGPHGIISLKHRGENISSGMIYQMLERAEEEGLVEATQHMRR